MKNTELYQQVAAESEMAQIEQIQFHHQMAKAGDKIPGDPFIQEEDMMMETEIQSPSSLY